MRDNVKAFVRILTESLDFPQPIVEIGSLQVFGQVDYADLRPYFSGKQYIGCDMRPGPGVDRIERFEELTFPDASVGSLLALDTLEHVARLPQAIDEAFRVLRHDGVFVISSHMLFPIHAEPNDYWRFTPEAFALLLERFTTRWVFFQGDATGPHTVMAVACKAPLGEDSKRAICERLDEIPESFPDFRLGILYRYEQLLTSLLRRQYPRSFREWIRVVRSHHSLLPRPPGWRGAARRSLRPPTEMGALDYPRDGAIVYGQLAVWGWVLGVPLERVEIWLDDMLLAEACLGRPRPDLASAFPHLSDAGSAGFQATVEVSAPPGPHRLAAVTRSKDNTRVLIAEHIVYIPPNSTRRAALYER